MEAALANLANQPLQKPLRLRPWPEVKVRSQRCVCVMCLGLAKYANIKVKHKKKTKVYV